MKQRIIIFLLLTSTAQIIAQTIHGQLKQHAGQQISLMGFNYYQSSKIAQTTADSLGNFILNYPKTYKGMGVLQTQDKSSLIVALTEPVITIKGTHIKELDSLHFVNSIENVQFENFVKQHVTNLQAYQAWRYLQPLYSKKNTTHSSRVLKEINKEIERIENAAIKALQQLPKEAYLYWFLPKQLLVHRMPATAQRYTERLPKDIAQFRHINFSNPNFKTSGLFRELIEGHYLLLENMGQSLDRIAIEMNKSTEYLITNLQNNKVLLNTVSEKLFNYFEKRSLFQASEYLAVRMLANKQCVLNDDLAKKFENYRKLKVGNTAPEIILHNGDKLSSQTTNTLVVFGASWCPKCSEDFLKLTSYYNNWSAKLTVIYISLDTDKAAFNKAYKNAAWQTYCDYKGWDTKAAKDYFITGTPSYFLLDENQKILVRPSSLEQIDAWVNYKL